MLEELRFFLVILEGARAQRFCQSKGLGPQINFRSAQIAAVLAMVQAGLGISVIPEMIRNQGGRALALGHLDPAGFWACSKDVSQLCHAHPIPCSRTDNNVLEERLRRRASAKLC
jgi:DNA-binding transcriptional LysR family regulator